MILPDVNVLVYAYRREAAGHDRYAGWLADLVGGTEELALPDVVLTGFLRIVTNPRIFADPAPTAEALKFVHVLRGSARGRWLPVTTAAWDEFDRIAGEDPAVRGNLVPDGWLAALAIAHGARLATSDRGMARFTGLTWFDPLGRQS